VLEWIDLGDKKRIVLEDKTLYLKNLKRGEYLLEFIGSLQTTRVEVIQGKIWANNEAYLIDSSNTYYQRTEHENRFLAVRDCYLVPGGGLAIDVLRHGSNQNRVRAYLWAFTFVAPDLRDCVLRLRRLQKNTVLK
jgi:hypothetical protein